MAVVKLKGGVVVTSATGSRNVLLDEKFFVPANAFSDGTFWTDTTGWF